MIPHKPELQGDLSGICALGYNCCDNGRDSKRSTKTATKNGCVRSKNRKKKWGGKIGKAKILVVEDQRIVALNLKNRLKNLGYDVSGTAISGEQAIKEAELINFDIVLMDIMLKGNIDGIEAAQIIKARFGIPIIYLTACTDSDTLERATLTNPDGYIAKPFKEEDLCRNIEMALHKSQSKNGFVGSISKSVARG